MHLHKGAIRKEEVRYSSLKFEKVVIQKSMHTFKKLLLHNIKIIKNENVTLAKPLIKAFQMTCLVDPYVFHFNYLVRATAGGPVSPLGYM